MHVLTDKEKNISKEKARAIETASLQLLASLCKNTEIGRKAVSTAEECGSCVEFSLCCVVLAMKRNHGTDLGTPTGEEANLAYRGSSENIGDEANSEKARTKSDSLGHGDSVSPELELAAFSFLAELVRVKVFRQQFLGDSEFLQSTSMLATDSKVLQLQCAALRFLVRLAPFLEDREEVPFSASHLASVFSSLLKVNGPLVRKQKMPGTVFLPEGRTKAHIRIKKPESSSESLVPALAASGLGCFFDIISEEAKTDALRALSNLFILLVDLVLADTKKNGSSCVDRQHNGLLGCNITTLFLEALGNSACREVLLQPQLMSAMIRLLLVQQIGGAENRRIEPSEDRLLFNASVTQCLQFLSVVMRPASSEFLLGSSWGELISAAETSVSHEVSRKRGSRHFSRSYKDAGLEGSTKEHNFTSVMQKFVGDEVNSVASVAAKRVLEQLGN